MGLPAGKKLFVITTLIFSILLRIFKIIRRKMLSYGEKKNEEEKSADLDLPPEEKIVVATK